MSPRAVLLVLTVALCAAGALGAGAGAPPGVGRQYFSLINCLSTNFPALAGLLVQEGLERAVWRVLKTGGSITIMAPSDRAIAAYSPNCTGKDPELSVTLLQHALQGKLYARRFINLGIRSKFPTFGPRPLTKLWSSPPLIGITNATKTLSFARITQPEICFTRNTMVHGINRVLFFCPS